MFYQNLIDQFVSTTVEIFREKLTGIYLHGSMVMGCFHPEKSDIDLIIIIEETISNTQKMEFMKCVVDLNRQAPQKGLEISLVKRKYCNPFVYPTPFELHFSPVHLRWFHDNPQNYVENMNGKDKDLAAHFTIINQYGIVLYGEEIAKVFAPVPKQNYIDSICSDLEDAENEIVKQPVYITLNMCRVLAFLQEGLCLSKEEGGKWGLAHLTSGYHAVISDALECYTSGTDMTVDEEAAGLFAKDMMRLIREKRESLP